MANTPYLPDILSIMALGINPKTGLPMKMDSAPCMLKDTIKRNLRIIDELDAINRFHWYNLPDDLDGNLLERILYYRYQGAFFYEPSFEKFFFLPYSLNGSIDVYGRYTGITPLPFYGSNTKDSDKPWINGLKKSPVYSVNTNPLTLEYLDNSCVLLADYSRQISQFSQPRQVLNDGIIEMESELLPYMRTALSNSTGVLGMRLSSQDEEAQAKLASDAINVAALSGQKYVPIIGAIDFLELAGGSVANAEEFAQAMETVDNFRLSTMGISNGGIWRKREQILEAENKMAGGTVSPIIQDGLYQRQQFCNIVNSIWGLGIWCDIDEAVSLNDKDMDGDTYNEEDMTEGQGAFEQAATEGGSEE